MYSHWLADQGMGRDGQPHNQDLFTVAVLKMSTIVSRCCSPWRADTALANCSPLSKPWAEAGLSLYECLSSLHKWIPVCWGKEE